MRDVCRGLDVAHTQGILHCDLKPANLLLALPESDSAAFLAEHVLPTDILDCRTKVTDFGIAKVMEGARTVTAGFAGSPLYMAPEQFRGETQSAETDVYALGLIAYEMITGQPPFPRGDPGYHHVHVMPEPLANCSARVGAAVMRALAKQRPDRFPSAIAFLEALGHVDDRAAGIRSPLNPPPDVALPVPRKRWTGPALSALLVAGAIGLLGWLGPDWAIALWEQRDVSFPTIKLVSEPAPNVSELPPVV